jgi:hypothetical protein
MRGGSIRHLLLALALAAMGVRAAAPPGYMFSPSPAGFTVTLCNGGTMRIDLGRSPEHGQHSGDSGPCLFAAAAHAAPAPIAPQIISTAISSVAVAPPIAAVSVGHGLAAPPPPATGPPIRL